MPHRVLIVFGTRPEAIKLAPVIRELYRRERFEPVVAVSGQHREMLDQVLQLFAIEPAYDLDIMQAGQSLTDVTVRALGGLTPLIEDAKPDVVMVQGDTTTTFAGALAAFYHKVPVAHVEAGYRTNDRYQPFPEEINRRLVGELATWHFAVNENCAGHLCAEAVPAERVVLTGNTGIDALFEAASMPVPIQTLPHAEALEASRRIVLMTMHRRENWGGPIEEACRAARRIAEDNADVHVYFAVHLNPSVQRSAREVLEGADRVTLLPALGYLDFTKLLADASLVMSDSGGVHEEALALGKPLLLLRNVSEWPEAVASGQVTLVGTDEDVIVREADRVLTALREDVRLPLHVNPLADGQAAVRLVDALERFLDA